MSQKERENFYRHSTVIVDVTKESFFDLLTYYLSLDKITLVEFIEKNSHDIYHFHPQSKACCCLCNRGYHPPKRRVLHPQQYELLFDINGGRHHNPKKYKESRYKCMDCCSPVNPTLTGDQLDITLLNFLLINFTDVKNDVKVSDAVTRLVKFRNESFAHVTKGAISKKEYETTRSAVEKCLLVLARRCGKEQRVKQTLADVYVRPLDEAIYLKLSATLKEWQESDNELNKSLGCMQGTLETIEEKVDDILSVVRKTPSKRKENDENRIPVKVPRYDTMNTDTTRDKGTDEVEGLQLTPHTDVNRGVKAGYGEKNMTVNNNPITIKVLKKSDFIPFGETGKNFRISLELYDVEKKTTLKASAFKETATDMYEKLEEGRVYSISAYKIIQPAKPSHEIEVRLMQSTRIDLVEDMEVSDCIPKKLTIAQATENYASAGSVWLNPVIITAVGPLTKPKEKFLREVMLKDYSGKIKLNIWSTSEDSDFQFSPGDVVEICSVKVGLFNNKINPEFYMTYNTDLTTLVKIEEENMKELLKDENADEFIPLEMSIDEMSRINCSCKIIIAEAKIDHFAKAGKENFVFMNCGIEKQHGYLEERGSKLYCNECKAFRIGDPMVQLDAEIFDNSDDSVWVKLYNLPSQTVLGDKKYNQFLEYDRAEKIKILEEIEKKKLSYRFEIKRTCKNSNLVTKITKL